MVKKSCFLRLTITNRYGVLETGEYVKNPAGLLGKALRGQPLRYRSVSLTIFASRVFFCTAIAENMLRQNAIE